MNRKDIIFNEMNHTRQIIERAKKHKKNEKKLLKKTKKNKSVDEDTFLNELSNLREEYLDPETAEYHKPHGKRKKKLVGDLIDLLETRWSTYHDELIFT